MVPELTEIRKTFTGARTGHGENFISEIHSLCVPQGGRFWRKSESETLEYPY
jgi:hypothetical protein